MTDVNRFYEGLYIPGTTTEAKPVGTLRVATDGAYAGQLVRSTNAAVATWTPVGGGGSDWATTLAAGATSGGTNPVLTAGDALLGSAGQPMKVTPSTNEALDAGAGNTVANGLIGVFVAGKGHTVSGTGHQFATVTGNAHTMTGANYNYNNAMVGGKSNSTGDYTYGNATLGGFGNNVYGGGGNYTRHNLVSGYGSTVREGANGFGSTKGSYYSAAIGTAHLVRGAQSSFALGAQNNQYGFGSMAGGTGVTMNPYYSFAWGSQIDSDALARTSAAFGLRTFLNVEGEVVWGNASETSNPTVIPALNLPGAIQGGSMTAGCGTTNATPTVMTTDGSGSEVINATGDNTLRLRQNQVVTFRAVVNAFQTGGAAGSAGDSASWFIDFTVKRVAAGAAALVGAVTGDGTPSGTNDAGAALWNVTVGVTGNRPTFTVTGEVNKNIAWGVTALVIKTGAPS
jgi:hypothetical protein